MVGILREEYLSICSQMEKCRRFPPLALIMSRNENYINLEGNARVGFNTENDKALVYVGNSEGGLAGAGYYILLVKENGAWVIKEEVMTWIS